MLQQIIQVVIQFLTKIPLICSLVQQSLKKAKQNIVLFVEKNGRIYNYYEKIFLKIQQVKLKENKKLENIKRKEKLVKSDISKKILESWFEVNKNHPYVTQSVIIELSLKTNLDFDSVKRWIENKRTRTKDLSVVKGTKNNRANQYFTCEDNAILKNFYKFKSNHPGPKDLELLKTLIEKDEKKIRNWFNLERFRQKKLV